MLDLGLSGLQSQTHYPITHSHVIKINYRPHMLITIPRSAWTFVRIAVPLVTVYEKAKKCRNRKKPNI